MSALRQAAGLAFHHAGATAWLRNRHRGGVRILTYHQCPPKSHLEAHCRHLRRFYSPISMDTAASWIREGGELPEHAIVLTFDDGYRDFGTNGFPVLSKYGIPATVYLTSGFLDDGWLWVDRIHWCFATTELRELSLDIPFHGPVALRWSRETWREASRSLIQILKKVPNRAREDVVRSLPSLLRVTLPGRAPEVSEPMLWDEVKSLHKKGVTFGAHTVNHPILARVEDRAALESEIAGSKRRIEEVLGCEIAHFCYPNGHLSDFTAQVVDVVRQSGFQTATTTIPGLNRRGCDAYTLQRINVDSERPLLRFAREAAGKDFGRSH